MNMNSLKELQGAEVHKCSKILWSILTILVARRMTWTKFRTENPQILGATAQNLVTSAT